jgi:phage/plasmid-like protein (TIGR03299 family)
MAHEIDLSNNRANIAFLGSRQKIWHGLGTELTEDAPLEVWKVEAGLDWEVKESPITYRGNGDTILFSDKKALYRSDTVEPLSIVGENYKIVQPDEILEFFRDLVENNDMKLSTAGSLFGGKRFWALAELGKNTEIIDGDVVDGFLLLTTSVDGSLATTAKFVSERVVCNNTLSIAMSEKTQNLVKCSHKSQWDAKAVKIDLGLLDQSWDTFITNMRTLASTPMSDQQVHSFFTEQFYDKKVAVDKQGWGATKKVKTLTDLYYSGAGSDLSVGTAWGVLNAVTDLYTHGSGKRDASHQFMNAFYSSDLIKNKVMEDLLTLA